MNVDGVAPVNGPVQINMALPQHAVNGVGFGWNMWQATQALFFMPVPEPGTTTPPPPKKIVENTSYDWSDGSIFFGSSELTAAGIAGALLVGDLKSDGTFNTPRSNPLPVIFGTAQIQLGAFTKINGATVAAGTLLSVLKPDGLHIEGTGFGPMVQPSMTNRVLAFIPAYNPQVTTPPTGELGTLRNVAKASLVCMMAGADFIKTSTGKEAVNATLEVSRVRTRMTRDYYERTGYVVGFKPAGGIRTAKQAMNWQFLMKEELGDAWLFPDRFRFGASALLTDIERQLWHHLTGRYAAEHYMPMG